MFKVRALFNLHDGEDDKEKVFESVRKNVSYRGANFWILACAIIIASIGLNVNSTAVVIGAMLISPLMGPIVGAGFALGVYDFDLLRKSLFNLLNSTLLSLTVSTLYFMMSPFKDIASELASRTSPNIYDVLIAFFGGVVGVIAVTRTEKGNPIPGVAIATALMPPLCTAGYGLATAQWSYFFGAFYLYCINCVFIGIATFLIIKYLKYPAKKQVDERQQKQVRTIISTLIIVMLLPSSYLAYSLYREQQFKKNTDTFIENQFTDKGYTVVYKKTKYGSSDKKIELAFLSTRFEDDELARLEQKIEENKYLRGAELIIRQDSTDRFRALKGDILNEIKNTENEVNQKDIRIAQLESEIAKNTFDSPKMLKEARTIFTAITSLSISNHSLATTDFGTESITAVIYESEEELHIEETERLTNWLNERLSVKNVIVFRRNEILPTLPEFEEEEEEY
ncbi:TIGR00341 family protein [uncultured Flavobacterium sp.]|uniref:TIGR00341 family protein n=1 Tax=uncultured Flavobacterium sp. TaxID=165435 RepID=UPI0025DB4DDB|nr:TIGR00341 family protein [uncultured Flavobacterium sp.]